MSVVQILKLARDYSYLLMVGGLFVAVFLLFRQCNSNRDLQAQMKAQQERNYNNLKAMTEAIKEIKLPDGGTEFSKAAFIAKMDELEKYNSALYNDLKNYQKGLIAGISTKLDAVIDTITAKNNLVKYDSTGYGLKFSASYHDAGLSNTIDGESRFRLSGGKVVPGNTDIYSNRIGLDVTYGFRDLGDRFEVFAVSKSPLVKFNELNGVYTMQKSDILGTNVSKPKPWGLSVMAGPTFDFVNMKGGISVGIGISYDLYSWSFKRK